MRSLGVWLGLLLFGLCAAGRAADIHLPQGPGVDLVYAKCRTCHDLQYLVDSKGLLPAQWSSVLASMQDYGLEATPQEKQTILNYLTTYLGSSPPPSGGQPAAREQIVKADGSDVFQHNCATCHGAKGQGQPGYFPPLAGNADLLKDRAFPVLVVLNGLSGPIEVNGKSYDGAMPAFDHLSDADIAAVVNFIRTSWGNQARAEPVTTEWVSKQRKRSMAPADVHAYRAKMQ